MRDPPSSAEPGRSRRATTRYRRRRLPERAPGSFCVGGAQRRLLHLIGVHGRERLIVLFARANANHAFDRLHEDLAVTHLARARRRENRVDTGLHERLRADHFDLDFLVELHDERGSAMLTHNLVLAAVPDYVT